MRSTAGRNLEVTISEQVVMRQLFDDGHTDPTRPVGADFLAWLVDRHLWQGSWRLADKPFPFEDNRPDKAYGPPSGKMRRYQENRLAREGAEKAAHSAKVDAAQTSSESVSVSRKSDLRKSRWGNKN
jgi:hypothetical protein